MMIEIGKIYNSKKCGTFRVVEYRDYQNVKVEFIATGYAASVKGKHVIDGQIKDPLYPTVYGKGYIGIGYYTSKELGQESIIYKHWTSMLTRCYNTKYQSKRPTYIGCSVCEEWLNFQNFAAWFDDNYIDGWQLDKDILVRGNKVYSPINCCFVPVSIHNIITKAERCRGGLPIGVCYDRLKKKYKANLKVDSRNMHLGNFEEISDAFMAYKIAKESNIRNVAERYRALLPNRVYNSLISYEVTIND